MAVGVGCEVVAVSGFWSILGLVALIALGIGLVTALFMVSFTRTVLTVPACIVVIFGIAAVITFAVNHYGDGVGADSRKCHDGTHLATQRDSLGNVTDWFCVGNQ